MRKQHFDDDFVIAELESVNSELVKAHLAIPPKVVDLQDLRLLNAEAQDRVRSNPSSPTFPTELNNGPSPHFHVRNGQIR